MRLEEKIAVMQGFQRGELVESASWDEDDWEPCGLPAWNWCDFRYRLKPKTITVFCCVYPTGGVSKVCFPTREEAEADAALMPDGSRVVKCVEV